MRRDASQPFPLPHHGCCQQTRKQIYFPLQPDNYVGITLCCKCNKYRRGLHTHHGSGAVLKLFAHVTADRRASTRELQRLFGLLFHGDLGRTHTTMEFPSLNCTHPQLPSAIFLPNHTMHAITLMTHISMIAKKTTCVMQQANPPAYTCMILGTYTHESPRLIITGMVKVP